MSLHLYLNGGRRSMHGGSKEALGLLRERCKRNGLKIDQYDNYTGGYHLRPDSHWTYAFDSRGQVTGARKRTVTNVSTGAAFPLGGWDTSYSYDDIGNRTASALGVMARSPARWAVRKWPMRSML
ncbi:hypothetical protein [Verrucomicrobium sp. BvORR106]|uniref:hypothetical protein n=1 Tax=Verrucomicrobium sp. BvORR106 TaxID=1403819 RepID=UPI00056EB58B|nr:hypothetical protein [Verrucomicrobium sp. BvORR106]